MLLGALLLACACPVPVATAGEISVETPASPPSDEDVIKAEMPRLGLRLYDCYLVALARQPSIKGAWQVRFEVRSSGEVHDVSVKPRGESVPSLETCMSEVLLATRFGPLTQDVPVVKTYHFDGKPR